MNRRPRPGTLALTALTVAAAQACAPPDTVPAPPSDATAGTVVIVHGAWGGAWDWRETADSLEALGYDARRVTLTGLGERNHLLSPDIDLSTHVTDVVNVLRWEELEDVILVGHSYGGMVITGVAEVVPERIRRLVYFDAFLPLDGECALAVGRTEGPDTLCTPEGLEELMGASLANNTIPAGWVEDGASVPSDLPHPAGTLAEPLDLAGDPGNGIPAVYIITREEAGGADSFDVAAERAEAMGWPVVEYVGDHTPYRQDPGGIARLFVRWDP